MNLYESADAGLIGLLFFFAVFLVVAIWAYLPANRQRLESYKNIPLDEDEISGDKP